MAGRTAAGGIVGSMAGSSIGSPNRASVASEPTPEPPSRDHERLWTPWRMRYVGGGATEEGCLFCNRLAAGDDVRSLILHRGEQAFAIMNLYPYNTGHLMVVPIAHVASPEDATPTALAEMAALLPPTLRALRRVLNCDGFNLGINVGAVAGAGVADHLHQHIVPRWQGDANFMPILASTMVLPELIPVTYAKVRADLVRELAGATTVTCVALTDQDRQVLVLGRENDARLPTATADGDEPLWRAACRSIQAAVGEPPEPAGWAGAARAGGVRAALALRVPNSTPATGFPAADAHWLPIEETSRGPDGEIVAAALANLAPVGG